VSDPQDDTPLLVALAVAYGELGMAGTDDQDVTARASGTPAARHAVAALWARLGYVASGGTRAGFDRLAEGALDGDADAQVQLEAVVALSRQTLGRIRQVVGGRRGGRPDQRERDKLLKVLVEHWTDRAVDDPTRLTAADACRQVVDDLRKYGAAPPTAETIRARHSRMRHDQRLDMTYEAALFAAADMMRAPGV
jgi:hypothetical protein